MVTLATLARFEAKPGKETEVEVFLREALPPVQAEPATKAPELLVEPPNIQMVDGIAAKLF